MNVRDLVFVDLETSGLKVGWHEIVEVAAVRTSPRVDKVIGKVHRLVRMRHPGRADREALEVNRYDPERWDLYGVDLRVALLEYEELLAAGETPVLVGLNPIFDQRFLHTAFTTEGFPVPSDRYVLDVGAMAWPLVMAGHLDRIGLDTLCREYKVAVKGKSHTAMVDVERLARVYCAMLGLPWKET